MSKHAAMKAERESKVEPLDIPPPQGNAMDGVAFGTSQEHQKALESKEVSAMTIQISELKRKTERQENEIRKNVLEIRSREKDLRSKDQALRQARVEVENLTRDKAALQEQLKVAESKMTPILAEKPNTTRKKMDANRIRELEDQVLMTKHKFIKLEETIDHEKARYSELEVDQEMYKTRAGELKEQVQELTKQCEAMEPKVAELREVIKTKDEDILALKKEIGDFSEKEKEFNARITELEEDLSKAHNKTAEYLKNYQSYREEIERAKRAEAQIVVKDKDEKILENEVVIGEKELIRLRKNDLAFQSASIRMEGLVKSVEKHMSMLQKSEAISSRLTKTENERLRKISLLERQIAVHDQEKRRMEVNVKRFKAEAAKAKTDLRDAQEHLEELTRNGQQDAISKMRNGMATMAKTNQEELQNKMIERKSRIAAEEGAKAMKNRITFLLEQMGQASGLAVSWQEQKSILKTEIKVLYKANTDLRSRLMAVQRAYLEKHLDAHLQRGNSGAPSFMSTTSDNVSEDSDLDIDAMRLMPNTTESVVERAILDAVCAFTSGVRVADGVEVTNRKGRKREGGIKGKFKVMKDPFNGSMDIIFDDDSEVSQADSAELMNAMQVPIFLKFIQSRREEKLLPLFTEKMASMLNYVRKTIADAAEQAAEARMQIAKGQSKALNSVARAEKIRHKLVGERLAKQKATLKLIREQIRWSDTCIIMEQVEKRATAELEYQATQYSLTKRDDEVKSLLNDVLRCAEAAASASSSSAPKECLVGSLEIRVPESQLDDETLHGIFALLSGAIMDRPESDEDDIGVSTMTRTILPSQSPNFVPYLDRVLLLNLRENCLTDLSCNLLAPLLEKSSTLRMVDLRGNKISSSGATVVLNAISANNTIMYVSQKQGGFMLEGHREITTKESDHIKNADQPKLPSLRIDIRSNSSSIDDVEEMLIAVEPASGNYDGLKSLTKPELIHTYNASAYKEEEGNTYGLTTVTPQGLMITDKLNMSEVKKRPKSASAKFTDTNNTFKSNDAFDMMSTGSDMDMMIKTFSSGDFKSTVGSPTNRFGPTVDFTEDGRSSQNIGSLLDTHIRKLQEDQADVSSHHTCKQIDYDKFEKHNKRQPGGKRAMGSTWDGHSSRRSNSTKKQQRPYSAGAMRPNSANTSGLKAVRTKPKSPAEAMFLNKEKSSSVLETGPVIKDRVIPSGFNQSATVIKDMSPTLRKSSAFTLLDSLEKTKRSESTSSLLF